MARDFGWSVGFECSDETYECQNCRKPVPPGMALFKHVSWPLYEQNSVCLSCMLSFARSWARDAVGHGA